MKGVTICRRFMRIGARPAMRRKTRFARLRWRRIWAPTAWSWTCRFLVVFHDDELSRLTGFTGSVADYTYAELCRMPVIHAVDATERDVAPLLEDVLALLYERRLSVNIELKNSRAAFPALEEKTLEAVEKAGMREKTIYSSFNHYVLMKLREVDPKAKIGLLYSEAMVDPWVYANYLHADAIHPHYLAALGCPGLIEGCKKAGVEIHPWTCNDEQVVCDLASAGIEAVITNYPDKAREAIENR